MNNSIKNNFAYVIEKRTQSTRFETIFFNIFLNNLVKCNVPYVMLRA